MNHMCPSEWKLTLQEARFVSLLVDAPASVSAETLWERVGTQAEPQIVKVLCARARKKLARFGIVIVTEYGRGYRIEEDAKALLRAGAVSIPLERAA